MWDFKVKPSSAPGWANGDERGAGGRLARSLRRDFFHAPWPRRWLTLSLTDRACLRRAELLSPCLEAPLAPRCPLGSLPLFATPHCPQRIARRPSASQVLAQQVLKKAHATTPHEHEHAHTYGSTARERIRKRWPHTHHTGALLRRLNMSCPDARRSVTGPDRVLAHHLVPPLARLDGAEEPSLTSVCESTARAAAR